MHSVTNGRLPLHNRPLAVPENGNCLFNALSMCVAGSLSLSSELRFRVALELIEYDDHYKNEHNRLGLVGVVSCELFEALRQVLVDGEWCSSWALYAAATVIEWKIISVYSPVNGVTDRAYHLLNKTIEPRTFLQLTFDDVAIMWSRCQ